MALLEAHLPAGAKEVPVVTEAAPLGRFFDAEIIDLQPVVDMRALLLSKREQAFQALEAKHKADQAADIIEMARLGHGSGLEDAVGQKADSGAVWRRQTDEIAREIAEQFPKQEIIAPFFDRENMAHVSDGQTLYGITDRAEVYAYTSVISQHEMNAGVSIATEDMWLDLLTHIVTTTA